MLFTFNSDKLRILLSILLTVVLSCSAFAEVFFINNNETDNSELTLFDEESKTESEKAEEKGERKTVENPFEFTGFDGEFDGINSNTCSNTQQGFLSSRNYTFLYYPHINPPRLEFFQELFLEENSLFVLYHRLIFYDLI